MIARGGIRRTIALSFVSFTLLIILSAFPVLHHHGSDGRIHHECAACLLFHAAVTTTAAFVLSVSASVAAIFVFPRTIFGAVFVALEKNKRAPPAPSTF
jgi:hypothetical protein